jgi:hypothetical protein
MAKTLHWEDTTRYALMETRTGKRVFAIAGDVGPVLLDGPNTDADIAIGELVAAGCPIVRSDDELLALVKSSRGRPAWDLAGSEELGLWRDQWGEVWLKAAGHDRIAGAVHLSKYEALGLAEKLMELAKAAPR